MKSLGHLVAICMMMSLLTYGFSAAQDSESTTQDSTNTTDVQANVTEVKLVPSPDAATSFVFPTSSSGKKFEVAKPIPVVVALKNNGENTFNVTTVSASFMYPQDHRYFIQNYTRTYYGQNVSAGEERAFFYIFSPDPMLEPRPYGLVVSIFYSDSENNYTNVVFNSTIELIESTEPIDLTTMFTYIGVIGVAGLVGFLVYESARGNKRKAPRRRIETGTQKATEIDSEWLEGTAALRSPKSQTVRSPKGQTKKTK